MSTDVKDILSRQSVLVRNVRFARAEDKLRSHFQGGCISLRQATETAWVVLLRNTTDVDVELVTCERRLGEDEIEVVRCPVCAIPDDWTLSLIDTENSGERHTHHPTASPPPSYADALAATPSSGFHSSIELPRAVFNDQVKELEKCNQNLTQPEEGMDAKFVKVSNLPKDITEEELDLYFSNDKYGGGELKQITHNTDQSTAIIEFIADKVVSNVLGKCPHTLKGKEIGVEKYSPPSDKTQSDHKNNVVMVTNLPAGVSDEYIKLYFEHKQKSGGGDIDKLERLPDGTVLLTFVDDKDAERVISRGNHTIKKTKVTVSKWVETPLKTIKVTGFKASTSEELLSLFFENKNKSGGGKVESLHIIQDGGALVTFEDENDCKEVLARQGLVLTDCELTVTPWRQKPVEFKTVIVSGLAPNTDEEMIRLFFENSKKSGGGDIESVDRRSNSKTVSIKFTDEFVAKRVVEMSTSKGLHLNGAKLSVELDSQPTNGSSEATENISGGYIPDTIEVSGPIKGLSQDAIQYYFENTIRSGGGEISDMTQKNDDTKHITFKDPKVLDAVLSKTHTVKGIKLTVTVYKPKLMDPTKMFVANISPHTSDNTLTMFFEMHCGQVPIKIVPGETEGTVMILFKDKVDVAALQDICKTEPLDDKNLNVEPVPLGTCIRVSGFKDKTTKDALKLYFASQKLSDGGEINKVQLFKKEEYALVDFKDFTVADRVLQKKHHLEGQSLTLCTHYDCIGLVSIDGIAPPLLVPEPIIPSVDRDLLDFFSKSALNWKALETELSSGSATVTKPKAQATHLKVSCTLEKVERNRIKLSTWTTETTNRFKSFLDLYTTIEMRCLQETWLQIKESLAKIDLKEGGIILPKDKSHTIKIVGHVCKVKEGRDLVEKLKRQLEEDLERKKKSIKEVVQVPHFKFLYLKQIEFEKIMMSKNKTLSINFTIRGDSVEYHGLPGEISEAKIAMYEVMEALKSRIVETSTCICQFLGTNEARQMLQEKLREQTVVWETGRSEVTFYGSADVDLDNSIETFKSTFVETEIPIKDEGKMLLSQPVWQDFFSNVIKDSKSLAILIPASDKSYIKLVSTKKLVEQIKTGVTQFFLDNTVFSEVCELDEGRVSFIFLYQKDLLQALEKSFESRHIPVTIQINKDNTGIQVKGNEKGVYDAKVKLEKLTQSIKRQERPIEKMGHVKYLSSQKGVELLSAVESKFRVIIKQDTDDYSEKTTGKGLSQRSPAAISVAYVNLPNSRQITVLIGDMTEMTTDVIVNAANERLDHCGGLARDIVMKGGKSIQDESSKIIAQRGRNLLEGQVEMTGPGDLPCKAIIHAVGPMWHGGIAKEDGILKETVIQSLEKAESHSYQSISIPALSTGIFRYPLGDATMIIITAVSSYFKEDPSSTIKEVKMVAFDEKVSRAFTAALRSEFGRENVQVTDHKPKEQTVKWKSTPSIQPALSPSVQSNNEKITTRSGLQICLVKGKIAEQNVDVLVNSTNLSLTLKGGAVSTSLLDTAGMELQTEINQNYPNGLMSKSEVISTKGYKLNCQEVFHGSLEGWNGAKEASITEALVTFIKTCLTMAAKQSFKTIAFPALGTGNLKYPDDVVAKLMYETVVKYSDQHQAGSLSEVHFVVYPGSHSTVKAFETESSQLTGKGHGGAKSKASRRGNHTSMSPNQKGTKPISSSKQERIFQIGKMQLIISHGDITQTSTEAIVNGSNEGLILTQGATSRAILQAAGDKLQQQCRTKVPEMKQFGVTVTGGGKMKCKYVIHVDAQRKSKWKKKITICLNAANSLGVKSIAFPALGTGLCKLDPGEFAEHLLKALTSFQEESASPCTIQKIHLIVFQKEMVSSISGRLTEYCQKAGSESQSLFQKIVSFIPGATLFQSREDKFDIAEQVTVPKRLSLVIYSNFVKNIKDAMDKIEETMRREEINKIIGGTWADIIQLLSDEEVVNIRKLESVDSVTIAIQERIGRIEVQGMTPDVLSAYDKIISILQDKQTKTHEIKTNDLVASFVQWFYICDEEGASATPGLEKLDQSLNKMIEEAFQTKEKNAFIPADDGTVFCYDFEAMKEYPLDDPTDTVNLIRKDLHSKGQRFELPPTWTEMGGNKMLLVTLIPTDAEYKTVVTNLKNQVSNIQKIERVQNVSLYEQYLAYKGRKDKADERLLWHGTSSDTAPSINLYGFNRSYCGKNAVVYGNGVYFAVNAQYSASNTYSTPDRSGHKRIYQCKVLVGEYTAGGPGMKVPPTKSGHILYDSVVDNPQTPSIFVIFQDAQAYPEYLITFM